MKLAITSLDDAYVNFAEACDANGDGQLEGSELSIFNKNKNNIISDLLLPLLTGLALKVIRFLEIRLSIFIDNFYIRKDK